MLPPHTFDGGDKSVTTTCASLVPCGASARRVLPCHCRAHQNGCLHDHTSTLMARFAAAGDIFRSIVCRVAAAHNSVRCMDATIGIDIVQCTVGRFGVVHSDQRSNQIHSNARYYMHMHVRIIFAIAHT